MELIVGTQSRKRTPRLHSHVNRRVAGLTLIEVLLALALYTVVFATVMKGLIECNYNTLWISFDRAASHVSEQRIEQTQNGRWDPTASPAIDELVSSNYPLSTYTVDVNPGGKPTIISTNTLQITSITNGTIYYKVLYSQTFWTFYNHTFTNSVVAIRTTDQ